MKILLAEDEAAVRRSVLRVIAHSNPMTRVFEAANGFEALDLIKREDPDILVTDLGMPLMNGVQLIEAVRALPDYEALPIICLSTSNDREDILKLAKLHVTDYVLKPFRPMTLSDRLQRAAVETANWKASRRTRAREEDVLADRVLIVDPDQGFRAFVRSVLEPAYDVIEAEGASTGLHAFQTSQRKPAIVLMGHKLRGHDADRLAETARKLAVDAGLAPTIVILVADPATQLHHAPPPFVQTIRHSVVPDEFLAAFRAAVQTKSAAPDS